MIIQTPYDFCFYYNNNSKIGIFSWSCRRSIAISTQWRKMLAANMLQFFFKIAYMKTILRVIVSLTKGYCYNTFFCKLPVCIIDEYIFNMNFLTGGRRSAMPRRVSITSTLQLCLFMHSSKIHTITRRKRTSKCVDERIEKRMTEPIQRGHLRESCPTAATHGVTGTRLPPITSASDNHFGWAYQW